MKIAPSPWLGSDSSFGADEAINFLLNPKHMPIKSSLLTLNGTFLFCRSGQSGSSPVPGCDGDPASTKLALGDVASPQGKGGERSPASAQHCWSSLFLRVCSSTYSSESTGRRLLGVMGAILVPGSALVYLDLQ